ncbi:hypothetical protein J6590_061492 [Homalodisca vitripennis]|nr:hypothetical protein J6590_061492 [Homalodisca vitripennis]
MSDRAELADAGQTVSESRGKHSALWQNSDDTFGSSRDHSYASVKSPGDLLTPATAPAPPAC